MGLSKTAFAKLAGVSRVAVHKAIKTGRVVEGKNGKISEKNKTNIAYIQNCKLKKATSKKSVKKKAKKKQVSKKNKPGKPKASPSTKEEDPHENDIKSLMELLASGKEIDLTNIDRPDAELLKIIEQIKGIQVKTDVLRFELIDRNLIQKFLGEMFMIEVNEFLTIGDNIGAEVAGMMGFNDNDAIIRISKFIEKKCYKVLEHKKKATNNLLKKIKAEELQETDERISS